MDSLFLILLTIVKELIARTDATILFVELFYPILLLPANNLQLIIIVGLFSHKNQVAVFAVMLLMDVVF